MIRREVLILAGVLLAAGCSQYEVVPDRLEGQVRDDVPYEQVVSSPKSYEGELLAWGGRVLKVSHHGRETEVEILHLPLDQTLRPIVEEAGSRGRFVAIDAYDGIDDPTLLEEGTLVTVIGRLRGMSTKPLDQGSYDAPELLIRDMTAWEQKLGITHYPFFSPYQGYRPFVFWDSQRVVSE